mgnify:CR=1 FL=1|jgi:hypothetical protein|tara:strand:- start:297 stop:515 length:219 start_codon:yes stop_codon:yes gene_type:complete
MKLTKGEEYQELIDICEKVDKMVEQVDAFCKIKYEHTNWAFTDDLSKQELEEIKDKKLGEVIPSIIFYYKEI